MNRYLLPICAMVFALTLVQVASATVDVKLNLEFNNPKDADSGGNWTVSALAGHSGLAGIEFQIEPANFTGDFLISNTIFTAQPFSLLDSGIGFKIGAGHYSTPTFNIGVGSYVGVATGAFDHGSFPELSHPEANEFANEHPFIPIALFSDITTSLTTNLVPEPATSVLTMVTTLFFLTCRCQLKVDP